MKSRRVSKKIVIFSGFFTVLFCLYLYFGLTPGNLKHYAIREIEKFTENKIRFSKILYLPFRGLSFYDLSVSDKKGSLIFSTKQLAVNAKIIPFFREKKIIVSNVYLDAPVYDFQLKPRRTLVQPPPKTKLSGEIEVPVLPDHPAPKMSDIAEGPDAFLPENVYLEQIQINNGTVRVRDNAQSPVIEEIRSINIRMGFQKPPILRFDGSVLLGRDHYCSISLNGTWNLDKAQYEFYFRTKSKYVPAWLLEYQKKHFLILKNGEIYIETYLKSIEESRAVFHSRADLRNGNLTVNKGSYTGHMSLDAHGLFNFYSKSFERYRGDLSFLDVDITNLSKDIQHLESIKGKIRFERDILDIQNLSGHYKNVDFTAMGTIRSFKNLILDASIRSNASISQILLLIPKEQKKILTGFEIQGICQARTTIRGSLRKPAELEKDYKLILTEGSLKNAAKKISVTNMSADITMDKSGVTLKNCRFTLAKASYFLNLFIPKDPKKSGRIELRSNDLKIIGTYLSQNGKIVIRDAQAFWAGITAKFQGMLSDLERPYLNIKGSLKLDLAKLPASIQTQAPALKDLGLRGNLGGIFALEGFWNDPLHWNLKLDGSGNPVYVSKNYRLDHLKFQLRLERSLLTLPYYSAQIYSGTLGGSAFFDLARPGTLFSGKLYMNQLDLRSLIRDLPVASKELAGTLNAQVSLEGTLKSQETYTGKGFLNIRNGYIWKTDLFKQMGSLPLVKVVGLDSVVFNNLGATFEIHDKKIWTEDLRLTSETVSLLLQGNIGFDQSLDMIMNIRYTDAVINGAFDTGGIVPFMVQQAEDMISQYKIGGTIKNPKYDKMMFPVGRVVGKKLDAVLKTLATS